MENLLPLITGGGGALVVLSIWVWAFATSKIHSDRDFTKLERDNDGLRAAIDKLQEALTLERQQVNDVAQSGTVTNQLISGLLRLAESRASGDGHPGVTAAGKDGL